MLMWIPLLFATIAVLYNQQMSFGMASDPLAFRDYPQGSDGESVDSSITNVLDKAFDKYRRFVDALHDKGGNECISAYIFAEHDYRNQRLISSQTNG